MLRQALQRSAALHAQRLAGGQLPCLQRLLGLADAAGTSGAAASCESRYPQQRRQQQQRWGARHYSGEADPDDDDDDLAFRCSERVKGIADGICELTLLEIHDLTELLKKKLGVTMPYGGMPMMGMPGTMPGAAAAAPAAEAAAPEEEKTDFDIKLDGFDATSKIKVIKEVRVITGLGLKESKELVEGAPAVVKKGVKKEEAEAIKAQLEAAGAKVVLE